MLGGNALDHSTAGAVPVIAIFQFVLLYDNAEDIFNIYTTFHWESPTNCIDYIGANALDHSATGTVPVIATYQFVLLYPIPSHEGNPTSCVGLISR